MKFFRSRPKEETVNEAETRGVAGPELRALLHRSCEEGLLIALMTNQVGQVCQGRLRMLDGDALFIELLDPRYQGEFKPLSLCCGMFNRGPRAWAFLSNVRSHQVGNAVRMISIQAPEHMTSTHGRTSFRTPLSSDMPLAVTLESPPGSDPIDVEARDISLGGLRICLPEDAVIPRVDDEVVVSLRFTPHAEDLEPDDDLPISADPIAATCQVRHVSGREVGLYFKAAMKDGQLDPPRELRGIAKGLEALWLRSRVH